MFVPREYQKNIINHIIEHKRCCVFAGMGMGKTASTLFAVSALKAIGEVKKVLVLAPLRVASSTWPDEVQKWAADLNSAESSRQHLAGRGAEVGRGSQSYHKPDNRHACAARGGA